MFTKFGAERALYTRVSAEHRPPTPTGRESESGDIASPSLAAAMNGRHTHNLTDRHQPGYDYTATMPDMREMVRRMQQLQSHAPLEVPQTPPDLGRRILRMKLQPFQQAPVANETTLARVRAANGSKPLWTISSRNSGPLQAQDMEPDPEADDCGEADYTLNPDLDNPPYQPPAVTSAAAPSATAQPPLSPQALAPPSPSPPPVAAASSDVAATSAVEQREQLTQLRSNQEEAEAVKRKMVAELVLVAAERELLRIKSAGTLARASAQADGAEEKAKAEAEARAQAKAEADAIREAETRLKAVMPYLLQLPDPTKLRPAIEAAKKAGVPATSILAAEVKLREAIEKAEAVARLEAEGNLRAAMPNIFQPASSAQLQPAIAAAKHAGVAAATVAAAEAALREAEDQHRVGEKVSPGPDRVAEPSFPFVLPRWSQPFALFFGAERRGSKFGRKVTEPPPKEPGAPEAKSPRPQLLLAAMLSDVDDRLSGPAGVVYGKAAAGASASTAAVSRATGSSHATLEAGEDEGEDEYYYSSNSSVAAPEAAAALELATAQGTATKSKAAATLAPLWRASPAAAPKVSNQLSPRTPVSDDYDYEYYI